MPCLPPTNATILLPDTAKQLLISFDIECSDSNLFQDPTTVSVDAQKEEAVVHGLRLGEDACRFSRHNGGRSRGL